MGLFDKPYFLILISFIKSWVICPSTANIIFNNLSSVNKKLNSPLILDSVFEINDKLASKIPTS